MELRSPLPELVSRAGALSDEDLLVLIRALTADYKARRKRAALEAARGLRVGDDVEVVSPGRLPLGACGHVNEIRRGTVSVHFPEHGFWKVQASGLRKVPRASGAP